MSCRVANFNNQGTINRKPLALWNCNRSSLRLNNEIEMRLITHKSTGWSLVCGSCGDGGDLRRHWWSTVNVSTLRMGLTFGMGSRDGME